MIDSGILIAYAYEKDEYHKRAKETLPEFVKKKRHITDYVAIEVANFLLKKVGFEAAKKVFAQITTSKNLSVIYNDELSFKATQEIFTKNPGLSFTDSNIVMHMQRLGIKEFLSFDAGFDKVKGIQRVH